MLLLRMEGDSLRAPAEPSKFETARCSKRGHLQSAEQLHLFSPGSQTPFPHGKQKATLKPAVGTQVPPSLGATASTSARPAQQIEQISFLSNESLRPVHVPLPPYRKQFAVWSDGSPTGVMVCPSGETS